MPTPTFDFRRILETLVEYDVDFIVVGAVCGVLQGAPVNTFDLDVVHSRTPENVERLVRALPSLDAYFREHSERRLRPERSHLSSPGHQLLMTSAGPLDLLGVIGRDRGYEDLLPHSCILTIGKGLQARILDLATLITVKEETERDKDKATLAILRRTLEEKKRQERPS